MSTEETLAKIALASKIQLDAKQKSLVLAMIPEDNFLLKPLKDFIELLPDIKKEKPHVHPDLKRIFKRNKAERKLMELKQKKKDEAVQFAIKELESSMPPEPKEKTARIINLWPFNRK